MSEHPHLRTIRARVESSPRQVVLVVGAGVTIGALVHHECVSHATWRGLLEHGLSHAASQKLIDGAEHSALGTRASSGDAEEMVQVADRLIEVLGGAGGGAYRAWLEEVFSEFEEVAQRTAVLEQIAALSELGVRIATTNYDGLLERFLGLDTVLWQDAPAAQQVLAGHRNAVLHLHGHWRTPNSVILGAEGYDRILADPKSTRLMQAVRMLGTMVFVGMGAGLTDPNFGRLRAWASEALRESSGSHYWLVRRGEEDAVPPTALRDERTTPVVYDSFDDLPVVLRGWLPAGSGRSTTKAPQRHILLLLNVRVRGTRPHLAADDVRLELDVEISDEDIVAVTMEGDHDKVADPRWWEEVATRIRAALDAVQERRRRVGRNVRFVVAGHAPQTVFVYAGHLSSRRMPGPIVFVNPAMNKRSWDVIETGGADSRAADYELFAASSDSLQRAVPRYAVFASAGKIPTEPTDLCPITHFDLFRGSGEHPLANSVAALSKLLPRPRPGTHVSKDQISIGWSDHDALVKGVLAELERLNRELGGSRGVVGYLGPVWGAFELGRALRSEVHGDLDVPHFSMSRDKYLPALTLSDVAEPVWFRQPRFLLLGAEPVRDTKVRVGATFTATQQALSKGGFSGEDVVQADGNVYLGSVHERCARFKPHVVLLVAHGREDGTLGLIGPTDEPGHAAADELVEAFRRSPIRPALVVLLACESFLLGERLLEVADHVVVSENKLTLSNAEAFSARFFALLAEGDSIRDAFETAKLVKVAGSPRATLRLLYDHEAAITPDRVFFNRR